ncbi:MAG: hypothetical protein AVDCRST_MAG36-1867 [uncultured Nocardioidaceae bacterium]|uniref:Uncharacterized protein n=1 Tax=uncultured Nocardioidaceae bacterium TaxID=253824 RepID=A0A6J4M3X9_9ACTN|nr:MAG: hypothetical protein AVDCRST_MAG36-1867 [uncultured Nocardioidaceae bacterium]
MRAPTSPRQQDEELTREGELCTTLLLASSDTDRSLTEAEVDRLLGVATAPD